jgi:cysteinyl-tRNA synthetase
MHPAGSKFSLDELGAVQIPDPLEKDISAQAWDMVRQAPPIAADTPSEAVIDLAQRRLMARANKDWAESDRLREQIAALGWTVQDSKEGYKLVQSS